jgi:hypothetical protein
MAVQTTYKVGGGDALPGNRQGRTSALKFTIDTATTNVAGSDVLKLMDIPENTLIQDVIVDVRTAEGGTLTIDIGDYLSSNDNAVDADGYIDGANGNSLGVTKASDITLTDGTPNTISPAYHNGRFYDDGDEYLGILFNNAANAAVFDVYVVAVNCNG